MVFTEPYKQNNYIVYPGDVRTLTLSFAVWLIDDFTGKQAIGHIRVMIKKIDIEAIKNLSGYYIFTDLANGQYAVDIFSDLYFFKEITSIDTSKIKTLDVPLEFDTNGPTLDATSIELKDVSKLQKDDIVEFRKISGEVEQENIIDIDNITGTISWAEGLEHDFSATGSTILALQNPVVTIRLKPLPSYPFPNNTTLVRGLINDSGGKPVTKANVEVNSQDLRTESDRNGEFVLYFSSVENNPIQINIEKNGDTGFFTQTLEEGMTKYLKVVYKNGQFYFDVL